MLYISMFLLQYLLNIMASIKTKSICASLLNLSRKQWISVYKWMLFTRTYPKRLVGLTIAFCFQNLHILDMQQLTTNNKITDEFQYMERNVSS